jgi:hypothetical protein
MNPDKFITKVAIKITKTKYFTSAGKIFSNPQAKDFKQMMSGIIEYEGDHTISKPRTERPDFCWI